MTTAVCQRLCCDFCLVLPSLWFPSTSTGKPDQHSSVIVESYTVIKEQKEREDKKKKQKKNINSFSQCTATASAAAAAAEWPLASHCWLFQLFNIWVCYWSLESHTRSILGFWVGGKCVVGLELICVCVCVLLSQTVQICPLFIFCFDFFFMYLC